MLELSAETSSARVVKGLASYCIPDYYGSKASLLAVAGKLAQNCNDITCTLVCRGLKTAAAAKKKLRNIAKIREVKTILAVTGDKASESDIAVFDLIRSVDKRRFQAAAAIVFTRKNEARRIMKKAGAGAAVFYTQPVFPENASQLPSLLKHLPSLQCKIRIGALIPFSANACRKIAAEKPDFIPESSFMAELATAENKGPVEAYNATVKIAKSNLRVALRLAAVINANKKNTCEVTGVHFFGLEDRAFGTGQRAVYISAQQLLDDVMNR